MRSRCLTKTNTEFHNYGGRGIGICARWSDFAVFLADMGARPVGLTLERVDVNGNYEPGNCRWATRLEQMCNQRRNRMLTMNGQTKPLKIWCRQYGIDRTKVDYRLSVGMPLIEALTAGDLRRAD